ncbi:LysM peptidoglycan-binding domain-containing protein [Alicyclobacillus tolerans]|uniref:LysM peptidoglycan-binding domain-containing protein n=1 Tax=Alicyclobacillus tolerans TaxID=90970 RepID=UPI001F226592|nr:LysM peptidoglycan-binding domain-containing protein [Alicyclobacillus tolerans]MCF8566956.1 LysM peptidoglycan-binding domain-containing protein [Alicyclobacillus tolerans]
MTRVICQYSQQREAQWPQRRSSSMHSSRGVVRAGQRSTFLEKSVRRKSSRRAVVLVAVLTAAVFAGFHLVANSVYAQGTERFYVVRPGDTVWSIAKRFSGQTDPRIMVTNIESSNGLDARDDVYPGEQLKIPSGM